IGAIKPAKDTSLAMLLEAQRRGHSLHYLEQGDLALRDGAPWARLRPLAVRDDAHDWFSLGEAQWRDLRELDIVLMRKDPPVDAQFIYDTMVLEAAQRGGVNVVNDPRALRDCNEKLFALQFPECCAPTLVSRDPAELRRFVAEHGEAVLKPLDGMGGRGIFRVKAGDSNLNSMLETLLAGGPQGDEFRGNLAAGGRGEGVPLSERDRWIAAQVAPELRRRGLRFVGLDVIGDYLTEINVTSPTCARELDAQFGLNIAGLLFDALEQRPAGSRAP